MAISFVLLLLLMLFYGYSPGWPFLLLPFFMLLVFMLAFGGGLLLSALNVKYRDFRYIIPFILQAGLYISPVGFSSSVIPEKWQMVFGLNPMAGIIDGFRWCILGDGSSFNYKFLVSSVIITSLLVIISVFYFRKTEKKFADLI